MENQFIGMSDIPFSYEDFETTRYKLINDINEVMTQTDKEFLVAVEELTVNVAETEYSDFFEYPSVKWKIQNLKKLKDINPRKLKTQADKLREVFGIE